MVHLSPKIGRLITASLAALALLWILVLSLPNHTLDRVADSPLASVDLELRKRPQLDLPFLAQDEPIEKQPDNDKARTADAFNRHVKKETMARQSRPAASRSQPVTSALKASPQDTKNLALDLDFLHHQKNSASIDIFDLPDAFGGPRLPDFDVAEGDVTWLNSRGVRYGGFFRRLQNSIAKQWDPVSALHRRDPTGLLYGTQDRQTVLRLRLNARGYLLEQPEVIKGSGLRLLDQEAVRAVVAAAPFANPPQSLLRNGVIDLDRFSFYFEIDRSRFYLRKD